MDGLRVIIVPGNGGSETSHTRDSNWYGWAADELEASGLFSEVLCPDYPSPSTAPREKWLPFLLNECGCAEHGSRTIVIGHSSGAVAALRLLEVQALAGAVLVSACHTDLGYVSESRAHYYPRSECSERAKSGDGGPWQWDAISENAGWIEQFHSTDDRFIHVEEARYVNAMLGEVNTYHEFTDRDHFFRPFEELIDVLRRRASFAAR
jgi:predicted alpha/beta hydrolase family esterase